MFDIYVDVSSVSEKLNSLSPGGDAQKFFTTELMKMSDTYAPWDSGVLKDTAYMTTDGTAIIYDTPYARYHWYGKLMVDPITGKGAFHNEEYGFWSRPKEQPNSKKVLTDRNMKYQGAPVRGPRWVERCFIDNKDELISRTLDHIEESK